MPDLIQKKPSLILHVCCIGCGAFVSRQLAREYNIILYFYNPCIYPKDEYRKRLKEAEMVAAQFSLSLIKMEYNYQAWLKKVAGHENDAEGGGRCLICYRDRLESTASYAKQNNIKYFTTTLTISPHKKAEAINGIGSDLAEEYGIKFLNRDFKKKNGFRDSVKLSRELNLYRQTYCGCEFSIRNRG